MRVVDVTAPTFVGSITGDFGALSVGDVSTTVTPDGGASFFIFGLQTIVYLFPSPESVLLLLLVQPRVRCSACK